jgi:hypothetical protein
MNKDTAKINSEQVRKALLRSGYLLEARLETIIRKTSYCVETNISYPDPSTQKSRELDLFAYHAYSIGGNTDGTLVAKLLIECVNNPQPLAFIMKQPLGGPPYEDLYVKRAGLPMSTEVDNNESLPEFLRMFDYHHYFTGNVASQYCSFVKKKGIDPEWMAFHEESHFESFRKLSDAIEYFICKYYEQWVSSPDQRVDIRLYYPILVVQGDLLEVLPSKRSLRVKKVRSVRYRRSAILNGKETYYQIDVVTEKFLPELLQIINKELLETANRIRSNHDAIMKAVEMKLQRLRGRGTLDLIRQVLES